MNAMAQLAPEEPLSPELVLVLSPELRAQALALLGPPAWPAPRPRVIEAIPERPLHAILATRVLNLALIFVAVTLATVALSLVAQAVR